MILNILLLSILMENDTLPYNFVVSIKRIKLLAWYTRGIFLARSLVPLKQWIKISIFKLSQFVYRVVCICCLFLRLLISHLIIFFTCAGWFHIQPDRSHGHYSGQEGITRSPSHQGMCKTSPYFVIFKHLACLLCPIGF